MPLVKDEEQGDILVNMSRLITPPSFSTKRSYERYKAELTAWTSVTSVKKEFWASLIALNMPDSAEEGDIRGKIFEAFVMNWLVKKPITN